jgi:hypothetical protein
MLKKLAKSSFVGGLVLFFLFMPIGINQIQFEITNNDSNSFHLSMLNDREIDFSVKFPCAIGENQPIWLVEFFGGPALRTELDSKSINLLVGHKDLKQIKIISFKRDRNNLDKSCYEEILYSNSMRTFTYVNNETNQKQRILNEYQVQLDRVIKFNPELKTFDIKISVVSKSDVARVNPTKIALILMTIIVFYFSCRNVSLLQMRNFSISKFTRGKNLIFLLFIIGLSLVTLPRGDDGWYLLMNKYFNITSNYDNYVFPSPRPSGYLHNFLNSVFAQSNTIFSTRLLSIIFTILTFILFIRVNKQLSSYLGDKSSLYHKVLFSFLILLFIASLNSLRPESVIAFLYILILYLIMVMNKDNLFVYSAIVIALIGLGLSTHQQATILLFAALPILVKMRNFGSKFTFDNVFILLLGSTIAIQLIFINGNIFWLLNTISRFTEAANIASPGRFLNNYPLYSEWIRPYHLYSSGLSTQPQIFMGTLLFISSIFLIFTACKLFKSPSLKYSPVHFLAMSAGLAPLGLLLSPIKWSWYYAPLYLNILLSYLILNNSGVYKNSIKKVYGQIIVVGVSAALAFTYDWRPNDFNWPLRSISIEDLNNNYWFIFGSIPSGVIWLIITVLVLLAVYLLRHRNIEFISRINSIFIIFVISLLGFIHITPPVVDAIKNPNEWTFVKQSVVGLWDKDVRCGLASTIKDEKTGKSIQQLLDENNWSVVSMPAPYIFIPCTKPVSTEAGSWLMPDVGFGWVPVYDQQRLATMTDITILGCDETLNTEDSAQRCFYKWDTDIKNLPPYKTTVVSYPDYSQLSEKLNPFN